MRARKKEIRKKRKNAFGSGDDEKSYDFKNLFSFLLIHFNILIHLSAISFTGRVRASWENICL